MNKQKIKTSQHNKLEAKIIQVYKLKKFKNSIVRTQMEIYKPGLHIVG